MVFARLPVDERASFSSARRLSDEAEHTTTPAPYLLPSGPFRARGVAVSDRELLRRVQCVQVTREFTASDELSMAARRRRAGWTLERHHAGFSILSRRWEGVDARYTGVTPTLATVATGTLSCAVEQLARLLRAPGESEFNALMRGVFKSRFIYGSLVHFVSNSSSRACGDRRRLLLPSSDADAQLAVRTTSFVHSKLASLFSVRGASASDLQHQQSRSDDTASTTREEGDSAGRNDQFCYAEYFVPTPRGFVVRYCSLPDHELRSGVAPRARVAQLHPFTGWLIAERVGPRASRPSIPRQPPRVRVTFRTTYHGQQDGSCSAKRAAQWMARVAKAVSRLGEVVRATFRTRGGSASTTNRSSNGLGKARTHIGGHGATANGSHDRGGHRNWHCIACTKSLFSVFGRTWRRCDLCAYSVCADTCCSLDHVAIYNRYVAPMLVCARCQECMDDAPSRPSSVVSPSTAVMWSLTHGGRASMDAMGRRRAMSDPPFIPTLELTSSGEDHSSSN